jgi:hypothetical protein
MHHHEDPNVGYWYKDQEFNSTFEVVAYDEPGGYVEIQYFSGEIEEIDLETWYELDLQPVAESGDCSGPFELTEEELGYSDETFHPEDWGGPLSDLEPDKIL